MNANDLPLDVLVTALTSRLVDLQCARSDIDAAQIGTPQPQEGSDRRASIAGHLLQHLEQRLMEGSSEFVSLSMIHDALSEHLPNLAIEELRFCVRFLDVDREIRFQSGDTETRHTRSWTRLVRYQARLDRVKLSEAGRLFLKLLRHHRDWLYEDKHIEMLTSALKSGLFDEVPRLCREILASLRLFSEQLTTIRESPSLHDMAEQYTQRRQHFTDMLERALAAALEALELLKSQAIQTNFEAFCQRNPNLTLSVAALRRHLRLVHQATESLNRSWSGLLTDLQRTRRQRLGVLRFDQILTAWLTSSPQLLSMEPLLAGCCGWVVSSQMVSVTSFIGSVEPTVDTVRSENIVFDDDPRHGRQGGSLGSWLQQHGAIILAALQQGPILLSTLLQDGRLGSYPFTSMNDLVGAMGLYVVSDPLGGLAKVEVTCAAGLQTGSFGGYQIMTSKLSIQLRHPQEAI